MNKIVNRIFSSFLLCTFFSNTCFGIPPKIKVKWMNENSCWARETRTIKPKGIMVHSTAFPGIMTSGWFKRWNKSDRDGGPLACVHAFVDDECAMQCLPWCVRAWHCGRGTKGSGNDDHISIEMCEPKGVKYSNSNKSSIDGSYDPNAPENKEYFDAALKNMVELCAYLCEWFSIEPDKIICHQEGFERKIASNHADVLHWWPLHGVTMNKFRELVAQELESQKTVEDFN